MGGDTREENQAILKNMILDLIEECKDFSLLDLVYKILISK